MQYTSICRENFPGTTIQWWKSAAIGRHRIHQPVDKCWQLVWRPVRLAEDLSSPAIAVYVLAQTSGWRCIDNYCRCIALNSQNSHSMSRKTKAKRTAQYPSMLTARVSKSQGQTRAGNYCSDAWLIVSVRGYFRMLEIPVWLLWWQWYMCALKIMPTVKCVPLHKLPSSLYVMN